MPVFLNLIQGTGQWIEIGTILSGHRERDPDSDRGFLPLFHYYLPDAGGLTGHSLPCQGSDLNIGQEYVAGKENNIILILSPSAKIGTVILLTAAAYCLYKASGLTSHCLPS